MWFLSRNKAVLLIFLKNPPKTWALPSSARWWGENAFEPLLHLPHRRARPPLLRRLRPGGKRGLRRPFPALPRPSGPLAGGGSGAERCPPREALAGCGQPPPLGGGAGSPPAAGTWPVHSAAKRGSAARAVPPGCAAVGAPVPPCGGSGSVPGCSRGGGGPPGGALLPYRVLCCPAGQARDLAPQQRCAGQNRLPGCGRRSAARPAGGWRQRPSRSRGRARAPAGARVAAHRPAQRPCLPPAGKQGKPVSAGDGFLLSRLLFPRNCETSGFPWGVARLVAAFPGLIRSAVTGGPLKSALQKRGEKRAAACFMRLLKGGEILLERHWLSATRNIWCENTAADKILVTYIHKWYHPSGAAPI